MRGIGQIRLGHTTEPIAVFRGLFEFDVIAAGPALHSLQPDFSLRIMIHLFASEGQIARRTSSKL